MPNKRLSFLIILFLTLLTSCTNSSLVGKKYYVLNCNLIGYSAILQEVEINFINEENLELKETLHSTPGNGQTYKTNSLIGKATKIMPYTYKNGILSIPNLSLILLLEMDTDGNLKSNTNEVLYKSSIVEIINSEEAKDRIKQASPRQSLEDIYIRLLQFAADGKTSITEVDGRAKYTK